MKGRCQIFLRRLKGWCDDIITHLLPLMEKGNIRIPSPLRLLRLVNNGLKSIFSNAQYFRM